MDKLERIAQQFQEAAWSELGQKHPLPRLFAGLMMVYYADPTGKSDLQWLELAMRPWFDDAEGKLTQQETEMIAALMWLMIAAKESNAIRERAQTISLKEV